MTEQSGGGGGGRKKRKEVNSEDVGCSVVVGSSLAFVFLAFFFVMLSHVIFVWLLRKRRKVKAMI